MTGAGGQVGRALAASGRAVRLYEHEELDVLETRELRVAFKAYDVVVHAAAMTDVDGCESDPEAAFAVNSRGTRNVAEAARAVGSRVVYLSTDYVFNGNKDHEYLEHDRPNPLNVYGRSKLEGERYVASTNRHLIIRTSWLFGDGENFVRKMMGCAHREAVQVVDDQRGRPTEAEGLAAGLLVAVERGLTGCIHIAGTGPVCSWAEFAETILATIHSPAQVTKIDTGTYRVGRPHVAVRPRNSALALARAIQERIPLFDWRIRLRSYLGSST